MQSKSVSGAVIEFDFPWLGRTHMLSHVDGGRAKEETPALKASINTLGPICFLSSSTCLAVSVSQTFWLFICDKGCHWRHVDSCITQTWPRGCRKQRTSHILSFLVQKWTAPILRPITSSYGLDFLYYACLLFLSISCFVTHLCFHFRFTSCQVSHHLWLLYLPHSSLPLKCLFSPPKHNWKLSRFLATLAKSTATKWTSLLVGWNGPTRSFLAYGRYF